MISSHVQSHNFTDRNGVECSLQKSSIATEDAIWLGCDHETRDQQGDPCGARMHLTKEMVASLLPILISFVETGDVAAVFLPAPITEHQEIDRNVGDGRGGE